MSETQAQHEAQVRAVLEKYSVLRKVVTQYNQRIGQAIAAGGNSAVESATPMICT